MGKRWVYLNATSTVAKKNYSADEVEKILEKALKAHGVDPAAMGAVVRSITPAKPKPVAKSAAAIEAERAERQMRLYDDLERQREKRAAAAAQRLRRAERSKARSADGARTGVVFGDADARDVGGAVTRLDLSPALVAKRKGGLFADVVAAAPAEPYTYRRSRRAHKR